MMSRKWKREVGVNLDEGSKELGAKKKREIIIDDIEEKQRNTRARREEGGTQQLSTSRFYYTSRGAGNNSSTGRLPVLNRSRGDSELGLVAPFPKLVVLDLDKTLWPFYCHEQTAGPYRRFGDDVSAVKCRSSYGSEKIVRLFPEVVGIFRCIKRQGSIRLAVVSRSPVEGAARGILGALGMLELFCCVEIHKGSKAIHFRNISAATGIPYRNMVLFDDDESNIKTVSKLGACCVRVSKESGLTFAVVRSGLKKYRKACLSRSSLKAWLQPPCAKITDT